MSKAATKTVSFDYPGKHSIDSPIVMCVGKFRILPRNYRMHPDLNDLHVGEEADILFSSEDYMGVPDTLRNLSKRRLPSVCYHHPRFPNSSLLVKHEITCQNSLVEAYHCGEHSKKTADVIYRGEVMLVPKEYTVYVGKDGFRAFMELDFCEHCIDKVWPEVGIWIDKYNITIAGKNFYDPDIDISSDLAKNFSVHPKMLEI